ncbi:MAG: transglycosylase SLT domain-containing protein [Flavobacteriales bacterium]
MFSHHLIRSTITTTRSALSRRSIATLVAGFICYTLPVYGSATNSTTTDTTRFDRVIAEKTITVVSVAGDTTFFGQDQYLHGFGYDLTRAYAGDLKVKLNFKQVRSVTTALKAVEDGRADFAMTTATTTQLQQRQLNGINLSCGQPAVLARHGLNTQLNWAFKADGDPLMDSASGFICQERQLGVTRRLAAFYSQNLLQNQVERAAFNQAIDTRLPRYAAVFQSQGRQHQVDWHLLAAMGYQESHLKADAVSPTGVRGLMMLTQATARGLGVSNREDPTQSIQGSAKYFAQLQEHYAQVPESDRMWFALAAYNMGPGAIDGVLSRVKQLGQDPHQWANVYRYLSEHSARRGQYRQVIHYVSNIRAYLENIKQDQRISRL